MLRSRTCPTLLVSFLIVCNAMADDGKTGNTSKPSVELTPKASGLDTIRPGDDITDVLQEAIDNQHECLQPIVIPAGNYKISKTIRTPFRSGWHITGSGIGIVKPQSTLAGRRTVLEWAGDPGGTMFVLTGTFGTFGNMTLTGDGTGVVVEFPEGTTGLGVGKIDFERLWVEGFKTGVQVGSSRWMHNCDCLHFDWLEARKCNVAYHGVNLMGMDIMFDYFRNYSNKTGLMFDGGGHVHVRASLTTSGSTLLKINNTGGQTVGKNNGFFRLSQTKVDTRSGKNFVMIDCEEPNQVQFLVDGGILENDLYTGTFARLTGRNTLVVRDYRSTFHGITGTKALGYRPTVLLDGCRLFRKVEPKGVNLRKHNCVDSNGQWIDENETD